MATWPVTLPQHINAGGYSEQRGTSKLETQMDSGPVMMRNLFTAVPTSYKFSLTLTSDQVDTLEAFYSDTCLNGTLPFDWYHPRKRTSAEMRFIGNPPQITSKAYDAYTVSFSTEIL
jgi:hypothetical protein